MVDAEVDLARLRGCPDLPALSWRKIKKLQRMTVRIAEFECTHASVFFRKCLRTIDGHRLEMDLLQFRVCRVHVGDHHGKMLEPQIGTS